MNTSKKETACLNCGNNFEGNYCPYCGQKATTKRLMLGEMLSHFLITFFGGDNIFLRTCHDLFVRPGDMQRDYLLGKRVRYKNPFQMFLYTITLYAVISYVTGLSSFLFDNLATMDLDLDSAKEYPTMEVVSKYVKAIYSNKLYGTFLTAFIEVFPLCLLFRTKLLRPDGSMSPLNLTEQFFVQIYNSCAEMIITIALLPLAIIEGTSDISRYTYEFFAVLYPIIMYKRLLGISWVKSTILNFAVILLTYLLLCVAIALPFAIAVGIDKLIR